jgi:peptide/nickel transport system permease protein
MLRQLAWQRLRWLAGVMLVVSVLAFGLQEAAEGDPARLLLQAEGRELITDADVAQMRTELGLDRPLVGRYLAWLGRAAMGDFGRSWRSGEPVVTLYLDRLPNTLVLAAAAAAVALIAGASLGFIAAYRQNRWPDALAQSVVVLGAAVPGFWLSFMLVYVFASSLQWLPAFGSLTLAGMALPVAVLALQKTAVMTRLTRAAVLDALSQPFVRTAHAKGLHQISVDTRHVLPAVSVPVLTVSGLELANLMTGAAVVEYVFAWPGIGKLAVDAVLNGDIPVVVGFSVFAAGVFVAANLVVDGLAVLLDPRLRSLA